MLLNVVCPKKRVLLFKKYNILNLKYCYRKGKLFMLKKKRNGIRFEVNHKQAKKDLAINTLNYKNLNTAKNIEKNFCNFDDSLVEITFEQLLYQWQLSNEVRLKGSTKNRYDNLIKTHILPQLGNRKLSEITTTDINAFLKEKLQNGRINETGGLSTSYVRSISHIITSAMQYAVSEKLCQPLKNKVCKPNIIKANPTILSVENQRILEEYIQSHINSTTIGIMISLYTGLRIGEVCALSWKDIDFDDKLLFVKHTVARVKSNDKNSKSKLILDEPKTVSSKRIIPISSPLFSILYKYRRNFQSLYVVSNTESFVSPRTYEARFHRIMNACHIKQITYHGLRHTFATRCIEAGVDIKSLSEILGHSSVSITLNTYVHSSIEMKKKQLEKLSFL